MTSMSGPAALDSQSLQFRQLCKLQTVNDSTKNLYKNRTHLVATCSSYGLIFIGERSGIKVIVGGKIYEDGIACNPKNTVQAYVHRNIALPASPTHIDVNSDQKLLSVTFILNETPVLRIYSIETFFSPNVMVMNEVRLSSVSGTHINDLTWNPGNPALLACCISDGTLTIYTFGPGSNVDIKGLPKESNSTCACWSPKGKQIAVGNINGFLTQYTPELKAMKNYPPPSNVFTKPCTITSLKWLSPFQFIGLYSDQTQFVSNDEEIKTSIIVVNTPKNGPVSYISYEDICYSSGTTRPNQFYFLHVAQWNVVFVASANAIEVGVLSLSTEENLWYQWNLDESARVILPMNKTEETFPVGVALDYGSQIQTPIGDALIPMPVFAVLTDEGLLCLYVINNFEQNTPCICVKPNPVPSLQCFTNANVTNQVLSQQQQQQPQPSSVTPTVSVPPSSVAPVQQAPVPAYPAPMSGFASTNQQPVSTQSSFNSAPLVNNTSNMFTGMPLMNANVNFSPAQVKTIAESVTFPTISQQDPSQVVTQVRSAIQKDDSKPAPVNIPPTPKYPSATTQPPQPVPQTPPEDASQKAANLQKLREEALKKLEKRATTFEGEIQSFKSLTSNLRVDTETRPCNEIISLFQAKNKKLKELNGEIRNEIDNLKTSIIEVTGFVKDIKSQQFLLTNPGYRSLSSAQDLDTANLASLKNIEKNIHYVKSQIELADEHLDEMWYKFCENLPESTTKVPKLENIYGTIVVQQKILKIRKLEMQSLEKKLKEMRYRMSLVQPSGNSYESSYSTKSYESLSSKEDLALAELTRKVLSLDSDSKTQLDASSVSAKCVKEYAKRFSLSNSKQIKLQELQGTHTVNYIRSAKLQRMKKKSLIILSKSSNVSEITPAPVKEQPNVNEILRQQLISPVSSDDGVSDKLPPAIEKAASSTPVKGESSGSLNVESTFVEEPSVIVRFADEPPKLSVQRPVILSAFRANKPSNFNFPADIPTPVPTLNKQVVDKENLAQPVTNAAAATTAGSMFGSFNRAFQNSGPVASSVAVSSVPSSGSFFGTKPVASAAAMPANNLSFFRNLDMSPKTTSTPLNLTSTVNSSVGSSLLGQSLASSVATNMNVLRDVTDVNVGEKNEPVSKPQSVSGTKPATFTGFFTSKLSQPTVTEATSATTSATVTSGSEPSSGLFKGASSPSGFASFANVVSVSTTPPIVAASAPVTTAPVASAPSSLFGKGITITPVPAASSVAATTTASIFGTSSIFGKPQPASESINFGMAFTSTSSLFGGKPAATVTSTSEPAKSSVFSSTVATSSLFGAKPAATVTSTSEPAKSSVFSSTVPTNSLFGAKPAATVAPISEPAKSNVFGSFSFTNQTPTTSTVTISEITTEDAPEAEPAEDEDAVSAINTFSFAPMAVKSEPTSTESTVTITPVTTAPFSSNTPVNAASAGSVIVTPTASTAVSSNTTTTASAFSGSFFGGLSISATTTTASGTGSLFGKPAATSVFGGSVFSQPANATPVSSAESKPIFGTTPSLFGQANAANQENKGIFGQANAANQENKGIFGQTNAANQPTKSVFGQPATANQENKGVFGQTQNTFQSGGGSSIFGSGGGSSLFGSGSGSVFSGAATATTQSNTFGSSGGSIFGSGSFTNTSANSSFQGTTGGFGSPPSFSNTPQQQQGAAGFGSPPAFSSVFKSGNQFSTFGSAPTFGGSPAFGTSPTKLFGQNAPATGTFGNTAQQPTAFDNLANENTMTFGNLAQQQQQSPGFGAPPSFGSGAPSPPSFGGSGFGGQSFNSWR